uniref:Guanine nucleotide-binding protein alpha-12 subunit n=1 Tax=Acrobeloides nanus TaxID=290746 RepID=A0A914E0P2_9BILA
MTSLASCCFGEQDPQTKTIDKKWRKEKQNLRRQVKILLLGSGESGKSTFIKQMVIIHGPGEFTADEVRSYRAQIYQNIISAMRVLLDARQKLGFQWERPERANNIESITRFTIVDLMRGISHETFAEVAPIVRDLWKDKAIRKTYDQRNLFQISESCVYFFEHINRVAMPDYYPTNRDILLCRKATKTITEHTFEIQKVIMEDRRTNRLVEARAVFETIVNNRAFSGVSIILFMNKSDLLQEKVPKSDIRQFFADFNGDQYSIRDVQFFLVDKFEKSRKDRTQPFFYHFTTAIDTENIRRVFEDCREAILEQNLKTLMMQ